MASNFNQVSNGNTNVHFSKAMFGEVESSRMTASPIHLTTFNAGDLVPVYCREILPDESIDLSLDFVIRQTTLLVPTMGSMHVDIYAFFVPNRIINTSWKAVQGENYSGSWVAPSVSLAPLIATSVGTTQIPVGSVADYYGYPTQLPIPNSVLSLCHDLKFRGYVMIWNEYFRDQNYQPPIPISYLNVYQGFLDPDVAGIRLGLTGVTSSTFESVSGRTVPDGSFGAGAVYNSVYGSVSSDSSNAQIGTVSRINRFFAFDSPLKANKLHDYFTSVLPSPQKSSSPVFAPVTGSISGVIPASGSVVFNNSGRVPFSLWNPNVNSPVRAALLTNTSGSGNTGVVPGAQTDATGSGTLDLNLGATVSDISIDGGLISGLALSVDDIRMASAVQQVYETLARGGSRYRSIVASFFGIEVDDPFDDIPKCLGHFSRDLDLFQTAQTSASSEGSTAQGNLAGFGYTSSGGHLFSHRFVEHGYLHIFAVVRHRNVYSSFMARDNFRLNMLDFYTPPMANISEQPVYTREINPFSANPNDAFGYQEAWAEYRYEPDMVSGYMRPGVENSLSVWNYADDFDSGLQISDGDWLKSNSESVLNRTLAVSSSVSPQLKGMFKFVVDKTLPMPTYSVPGMDII